MGDRKPFLWEVLPFLLAVLSQLLNFLEVAGAVNVVFTHMLPWSRPTIFVEGNFLVANQERNIVPLFLVAATKDGEGTARDGRSHFAHAGASPTPLVPCLLFPWAPTSSSPRSSR